ncbi:MAG: hypothetical protein MJ246_01615 [Clostridia bacterium]|nr:hypothetical protein [Clostridia bacterium]
MDKEWFKNLSSKIVSGAKSAGTQVNYEVQIKKNELEIVKVNNEINKIYKTIGETVYNCKNDEVDASNIDILCKQIDVKKMYIDELKERIELIKENKKLETYDVQDGEIPSFIKNEKTNEEIEVLKFCPGCGTGNSLSSETCKECGRKFRKSTIK